MIVLGAVGCALLARWAGGQPPAPPPDPDTVKLISSIDGATLYRTYCAVCHGSSAQGRGPMADSLKVAPTDLTRLAIHNGGEFPLARVEKVIAGDAEVTKGHGTRSMPVWGPIFSQIAWDQDLGRVRIRNVALYLRSIQTK